MFIPLHDSNPLEHIRRPYVNFALIGVTVAVFFVTGGVDPDAIQQAAYGYGLVPAVVNNVGRLPPELVRVPGEATYLTYAFLHANALHLLGNMLFLWVFGDNIEDAVGHVRYLPFYLLCAAAAGFAHSLTSPASEAPLIGASGAVAGIVGAYLVLHPHVKVWVLALGRIPLRLSAGIVLIVWIGFQVVMLFVASPEDNDVAWWAHIGGFVAGMALILVARRRGVPLLDRGMATTA